MSLFYFTILSQNPLPAKWQQVLPPEMAAWVAKCLFKGSDLRTATQMWYHPPEPSQVHPAPPASAEPYFRTRFFLWTPKKTWGLQLKCSEECERELSKTKRTTFLTRAGLYARVRKVLDLSGWYWMGTEYLECKACKHKYAGWSQHVLDQLTMAQRSYFPALLTYQFSCDLKVVRLLRARTKGNSSTMVRNKVAEQHREVYLQHSLQFLQAREPFHSAKSIATVSAPTVPIPDMPSIPKPAWFLSLYLRDVLGRLDVIKAKITSTFGTVLKMDSTKKITKKLAGKATGTVSWSTNVGNEYGEVLNSVLTDSEGDGLQDMLVGLIKRYKDAGVPPPKALYVDRGCCSSSGSSKLETQLGGWEELFVRLDIFHIMRRFSMGCTSESHALYPTFMGRLSSCIFEWDPEDIANLHKAKEAELRQCGAFSAGPDTASRHITKRELQRHCKRQTRGLYETTRLIQELIEALDSDKGNDTMGIPLFDHDRIQQIWSEQQRHIQCIQDPPGVSLYTQIGTQKKGGVDLPVYRCARGSTSLESFHLHINCFIPGTAANDAHFQAYLLDGIARWNENRAVSSVAGAQRGLYHGSYCSALEHEVNRCSQLVYGQDLCPEHRRPGQYTGELIGLEYLYSQTGKVWETLTLDPDTPDDLTDELDEGFEDMADKEDEDEDPTLPPMDPPAVHDSPPPPSPVLDLPPVPEPSLEPGPSTSQTDQCQTVPADEGVSINACQCSDPVYLLKCVFLSVSSFSESGSCRTKGSTGVESHTRSGRKALFSPQCGSPYRGCGKRGHPPVEAPSHTTPGKPGSLSTSLQGQQPAHWSV